MKKHAIIASCLLALALPQFTPTSGGLQGGESSTPAISASLLKPDPAVQSKILANYGKAPLSFEANQGQTDARVKFLSRGSGYTLFLTGNEAVLDLKKPGVSSQESEESLQSSKAEIRNSKLENSSIRNHQLARHSSLVTRHLPVATNNDLRSTNALLRMKLVGANPGATVTGADPLPGKSNYFIGNDPKKWRTNVPTYAKVKYNGVYPGVDLVYYGNQGQLEYDFVVAPGGDPNVIRLAFGGGAAMGSRKSAEGRQQSAVGSRQLASPNPRLETRNSKHYRHSPFTTPYSLRLAANGDLFVRLPDGDVRFHKPVIYQPQGSSLVTRHSSLVDGHYRLVGDQVTIQVPLYDRSRPLVIDPVLTYSTYLGGNAIDRIYGVAVNSAGEAVVVGPTSSTDFPTANAYQANYGGGKFDNFVTQLSADGTSLLFSTYLGGSNDEECWGVAFDASQNVYVSGYTASTNFPVTANAYRTSFNGTGSDAFLAKFNPSGSALLYSTYIAPIDPGQGEEPNGIFMAASSSGKAYIVGPTTYNQFPVTAGAFQTTNLGHDDAFLTVIDTTRAGSASLAYSTFLGGSQHDVAQQVAVDTAGNAYVVGTTHSSDFPVTAGAYQTACKLSTSGTCSGDIFLSKLNPGGHGKADLLYSTFVGGSAADEGVAVAVDPSGDAYLTGDTQSSDFPTTSGAFQTTCNGSGGSCEDSFVLKLNLAGTGASDLVYSTFFGGSGTTLAKAIAVDLSGDAYVAGRTTSTNFPVLNAIQNAHAADKSSYDAFVTELNPPGSALVFSTYLGGNNFDSFNGMALDSLNNIYAGGRSQSTNYPATPGVFQTAHFPDNGSFDAIVAKILPTNSPGLALGPASLTFSSQLIGSKSAAQTMTLLAAGSQNLMVTSIVASGPFAETNNCGPTIGAGGNCTVNVTFTPKSAGTLTGSLVLTTNAAGSPQTVALTGSGTYVGLIPASLNFGIEPVGTTSPGQKITLGNSGSVPLTISGISLTGVDPQDFAEVNTCGTGIGPKSSCSITVTFTPTQKGTRTANVSISDNGGGSPQVVSLTGKGN